MQCSIASLDTPVDPYSVFDDDDDVLIARPGLLPTRTHFSNATLQRVDDYSTIQIPVTDAGNLSVQSEPVTQTPRDDTGVSNEGRRIWGGDAMGGTGVVYV